LVIKKKPLPLVQKFQLLVRSNLVFAVELFLLVVFNALIFLVHVRLRQFAVATAQVIVASTRNLELVANCIVQRVQSVIILHVLHINPEQVLVVIKTTRVDAAQILLLFLMNLAMAYNAFIQAITPLHADAPI
jgi:hypothetical protein